MFLVRNLAVMRMKLWGLSKEDLSGLLSPAGHNFFFTAPERANLQFSSTGKLIGPLNPKPRHITESGSGSVISGKRSNSMGSRICAVRLRAECVPMQ